MDLYSITEFDDYGEASESKANLIFLVETQFLLELLCGLNAI